MTKIIGQDATQTAYLSEKQMKKYKEMKRDKLSDDVTDDPDVFARALGIPSF